MRKDIVRSDHEEEDAMRVKGWDYQNWLKKENRKTVQISKKFPD